jgi:hypothetical protein
VALALEESTRILVRITDLHDEAAGMQGQLAEAIADLERILARLEENEPVGVTKLGSGWQLAGDG